MDPHQLKCQLSKHLSTTMFKILLLSLALASCCNGAKLPSIFHKCNRNQPDLKECILEAAQHGVPLFKQPLEELKLPSINPFEIAEATIGEGKGTVAVVQNFKNCKLYGLADVKFEKFEFDFEKKTLSIVAFFPELKKQCQYDLDGKVLVLPIKGTGPSTVILKKLKAQILLKYEEIKKKNKTYVKIVSGDLKLDPEHMSFNFENLFNGDKNLGDNINKVLNENWKEVFDDVKDGYIELVLQIIINVFNNFFSRVSLEEALD